MYVSASVSNREVHSHPLPCCADSLEHWDGIDRTAFNALVDARDMQDTYLPAFARGVQMGKASGLMCSCES